MSDAAVSCEVLYISERSAWGELGYEMVSSAFPSVQPVFWSPGMPKPDISGWKGDWIFSFKSDLILSRDILKRAKKGAINFHPSSPKYRGVGGYWWALHNGDDAFGVTCHHMNERIDYGAIIKANSFSILPEETIESLKHKAAIHSLTLLNETLDAIRIGKPLAPCGAKWERHLYTYRELALAQSANAMNSDRNATQLVVEPLGARPALEALQIIHDCIIGSGEERAKALWVDRRAKPRAAFG